MHVYTDFLSTLHVKKFLHFNTVGWAYKPHKSHAAQTPSVGNHQISGKN